MKRTIIIVAILLLSIMQGCTTTDEEEGLPNVEPPKELIKKAKAMIEIRGDVQGNVVFTSTYQKDLISETFNGWTDTLLTGERAFKTPTETYDLTIILSRITSEGGKVRVKIKTYINDSTITDETVVITKDTYYYHEELEY